MNQLLLEIKEHHNGKAGGGGEGEKNFTFHRKTEWDMGTRLRIIVNYGMGYVIRNITGQSKDDVGVVFVCRKAFSQLDKISPYD